MATAAEQATTVGTTPVGFVYKLGSTIAQIGTDVLQGADYAGKIVITANGIVLNGYLVAEPNGALESSFAQQIKNLTDSTAFSGAVVKVYAPDQEKETKYSVMFSDSDSQTEIAGKEGLIYYEPNFNMIYFYVSDLKAFITVSGLYTILAEEIIDLDANFESAADADADGIRAARKATADSDGNKISETYVKKSSIVTEVSSSGTDSQIPSAKSVYSTINSLISAAGENYVPLTEKGSAGGVAELDESGKVPSSQLPGFVDDAVEGYLYDGHFYSDEAHTTLIVDKTGENADQLSTKLYVDLSNNKTYRWTGSVYTEVSESIALGETSSTAYPGSKGKATADSLAEHIADTDNPHGVTKQQVGLGNVDNTPDSEKVVAQATKDGNGDNIADTYIKKSSIVTEINSGGTDTQVPSAAAVYAGTVNVWTGTQAEYDALTTKDERTVYLVTDSDIVLYDYDLAEIQGTNTPSATDLFDLYTALYTNGTLKGRTVYLHNSYYTQSGNDTTWRLAVYQGEVTVTENSTSYTYQVWTVTGPSVSGESTVRQLTFGLRVTGTTSAAATVFSNGSVVTSDQLSTSPTGTSKTKAASEYSVSLVNTKAETALTQLTWQ